MATITVVIRDINTNNIIKLTVIGLFMALMTIFTTAVILLV